MDLLAPLVLLAPLAGLASLIAAAAINSNSVLVSLATLNTGKKKRSVEEMEEDRQRILALLQSIRGKQ